MNKSFFLPECFIVILLLILSGCGASNPTLSNATTPLKTSPKKPDVSPYMAFGSIDKSELLSKYNSFNREFESYSVEKDQIQALTAIDTPTRLTLVFGTWCHDSEREVPRILKLIEAANNPNLGLQLIAVKYNKQLPEGMPQRYQVLYTPTLFVEQNSVMIGNIVERPSADWSTDITALINQ